MVIPTLLGQSALRLSSQRIIAKRMASGTGTATNSQASSPHKSPYQAWFAIEAIPIYVIIGGAMCGAGWYLFRLARGPDVIWSKSNPTPWNTVQQDQNIKLMSGHHKFEKGWSR